MGKNIITGYLNSSLFKFEKYVKNFKHVVGFAFLQKNKDKFEIGKCKIPVFNFYFYV